MMTDILSLADNLEPNEAQFKGDLQKIAKTHVSFCKFYMKFASKCDAFVFDKKSQDYLESCIDHLENKSLTKKGIQQSRSSCLKMLESMKDLCVTLGCDKMLAGMHKLIDQAVVDDEGEGGGTLDLLQQLTNLLNAPEDTNDNDHVDGNGNDGRISPVSTSSSTLEEESSRSRGGVVSMAQYVLSDSGMDSYYPKCTKDVGEDSSDVCPQPKSENFSEDNADLFQYPNIECGFSTNSMAVAFGHYASSVNSNMPVKCPYCSLISYSNYELCEHLTNEHGTAKYKCGYCSYRSVSKTNCVYHQRDLHPGSPNKILGCEPLPYAVYKYSCRAQNTIKPFVCNDSCNFGTMIAQKFYQHILTHPGMMVTCHYCEKYHTDDLSDLIDHFLIHGVGDYHCMYCKTAFNFITKIEQHLHEKHPAQYPFVILCHDYDTRLHSLKGKYNEVQKLEFGDESIVVLPLESDTAVNSVNVVLPSESILIPDVQHCEMQLKTFMKNKEESEQIPYVPPLPCKEEILDLTMSEDPKERVDIKPPLGVRTFEELMESAQAPLIEPPHSAPYSAPADSSPEGATFHDFIEPPTNSDEQPQQPTPILTPAQVKQEMVCGQLDNEVIIEREIEHPISGAISSVQINKEVHQTSKLGKSPPKAPAKSPKKKKKPKQTVNAVQDKMEAVESPEMQVDSPSPQPLGIDENREARDAVAAALISPEARTGGGSEQTPSRNISDESVAVPPTISNDALCRITNVISLAVPMSKSLLEALNVTSNGWASEIVVDSSGKTISETFGPNTNAPILNEASIENIPLDFDCAVPQSPDLDTKQFEIDHQGNVTVRPRYTDLAVVDAVIISGEGEDDFEDKPASSTPSSSRPTTPSSASNLPNPPRLLASPSTSSPSPSKRARFTIVPKLTRIFPVPKLMNALQTTQPVLVIDPRSATSAIKVVQSTNKPIQLPPAIQSETVDVRNYGCKVCSFSSEDRWVTYKHMAQAHPNRFSKQIRDVPVPRPAAQRESFVRAVSCPYCPDVVYEGVKTFERHHSQNHSDVTEVTCFLSYLPTWKHHLNQIFACCYCGHFCRNEEAVWKHVYEAHALRVSRLKNPLSLEVTVALKKMVCPLHNCLSQFLEQDAFVTHVNSHPQVIACNKCTYITDSVEDFQKFHIKIAPEERLLHFYYIQSADERANLLSVQTLSHPLYSLGAVTLKHPLTTSATAPVRQKTTARKSTGGAKFK